MSGYMFRLEEKHPYLLVLGYVALICPALHVIVPRDGSREFAGIASFEVPQCKIGAGLGQGLRHRVSDSAGATGDDGDFAVHVEHVKHAILQRWIGPSLANGWSQRAHDVSSLCSGPKFAQMRDSYLAVDR